MKLDLIYLTGRILTPFYWIGIWIFTLVCAIIALPLLIYEQLKTEEDWMIFYVVLIVAALMALSVIIYWH